jgi:hypothetical protein
VNIMSTELAKLRRIVERADLIRAVVELEGCFSHRLERKMRLYRSIFGPWATSAGEVRHLVGVEELRRLFDADAEQLLTGGAFLNG